MSKRVGVILGVLISLIVAAGYVAYEFNHYWSVTVPKAYAAWWVGDLVIDHMDRTGGRWPREWDDLREDYDAAIKRSGKVWTFEDLMKHIEVDWNADPAQLATAEPNKHGPPFHVIRARDGRDASWGGHEPNQMIFDYLRERSPATQPADTK